MGAHKDWWIIYDEEDVEHDTTKRCWNLECEDETIDAIPAYRDRTTEKLKDACPKCVWFLSFRDYQNLFLKSEGDDQVHELVEIEDRHKVALTPFKRAGRSWATGDFDLSASFFVMGRKANRYSQESSSRTYLKWTAIEQAFGEIEALGKPWRSKDHEDLWQSEFAH